MPILMSKTDWNAILWNGPTIDSIVPFTEYVLACVFLFTKDQTQKERERIQKAKTF